MKGTTVRLSGDGSQASKIVVDGLRAFNKSHLGDYTVEPLNVEVVNQDGDVVGGALGYLQLEWLFVEVLWLPEDMRSSGLGSRILALMEEEAVRKGARRAILDTMGFQAEDFYRKHGYVEFGRVKDFASGFDRIYMSKSLVEE